MDFGTLRGAVFTIAILAAIYHAQRAIIRAVTTTLETSRAGLTNQAHEQLEARIGALEHRVAVTERYQISVLDKLKEPAFPER